MIKKNIDSISIIGSIAILLFFFALGAMSYRHCGPAGKQEPDVNRKEIMGEIGQLKDKIQEGELTKLKLTEAIKGLEISLSGDPDSSSPGLLEKLQQAKAEVSKMVKKLKSSAPPVDPGKFNDLVACQEEYKILATSYSLCLDVVNRQGEMDGTRSKIETALFQYNANLLEINGTLDLQVESYRKIGENYATIIASLKRLNNKRAIKFMAIGGGAAVVIFVILKWLLK